MNDEHCAVEVYAGGRWSFFYQCSRKGSPAIGLRGDRANIETRLCTQHRRRLESGMTTRIITGLQPKDGRYHVSPYTTVSINGIANDEGAPHDLNN